MVLQRVKNDPTLPIKFEQALDFDSTDDPNIVVELNSGNSANLTTLVKRHDNSNAGADRRVEWHIIENAQGLTLSQPESPSEGYSENNTLFATTDTGSNGETVLRLIADKAGVVKLKAIVRDQRAEREDVQADDALRDEQQREYTVTFKQTPKKPELEVDHEYRIADGSEIAEFTLTVRDVNDELIPGATVDWRPTGLLADNETDQAESETDDNGIARFSLKSAQSGTLNLTAAVTGLYTTTGSVSSDAETTHFVNYKVENVIRASGSTDEVEVNRPNVDGEERIEASLVAMLVDTKINDFDVVGRTVTLTLGENSPDGSSIRVAGTDGQGGSFELDDRSVSITSNSNGGVAAFISSHNPGVVTVEASVAGDGVVAGAETKQVPVPFKRTQWLRKVGNQSETVPVEADGQTEALLEVDVLAFDEENDGANRDVSWTVMHNDSDDLNEELSDSNRPNNKTSPDRPAITTQTGENGRTSIKVTATKPGRLKIRATVTDVNAESWSEAQTPVKDAVFTVLFKETINEDGIALNVENRKRLADGQELVTVTATVHNQQGEFATKAIVRWSHTGNHAVVHQSVVGKDDNEVEVDTDGQATIRYKSSQAESLKVTATVEGLNSATGDSSATKTIDGDIFFYNYKVKEVKRYKTNNTEITSNQAIEVHRANEHSKIRVTAELVAVDSGDNEDLTYKVVGKKVDWKASSSHLEIVTPQGGSDESNENGLITAEVYSETVGSYNIEPQVASDEVGRIDNVELEHTVISFKRTMWLNQTGFNKDHRTEANGTDQAELKVQVYGQDKTHAETAGRSVVWSLNDEHDIGARLVTATSPDGLTDNADPTSATDADGIAKMYVTATQGGSVEVTATISDVHPSDDTDDTLDATGNISKAYIFTVEFQKTINDADVTISVVGSTTEFIADGSDRVQVKVEAKQGDVLIKNANVNWSATPDSVGTVVTPEQTGMDTNGQAVITGQATTDMRGEAFITLSSSVAGELIMRATVSSVNVATGSTVAPVSKNLAKPIKFYNYKVDSVSRVEDEGGKAKDDNPAIEVTRDDEESFAYYAAQLVALDKDDNKVTSFNVKGKEVVWASTPTTLVKLPLNDGKSNNAGKGIVKVSSATAEQYMLKATTSSDTTGKDIRLNFQRSMKLKQHDFNENERTEADGLQTAELKVEVFGNDGINKEGAGRRVRWTILRDSPDWKDITATLQSPVTTPGGETQGELFDGESDNSSLVSETDGNGIASILVKAEQGGWVDVKAEVVNESSETENYDESIAASTDTTFRVQFEKVIDAEYITFSVDPSERKRLADDAETVTVTVMVKDKDDRNVKYAPINWSKVVGAEQGQIVGTPEETTGNNGEAKITYKSATAGNLKLKARVSHINSLAETGTVNKEMEQPH